MTDFHVPYGKTHLPLTLPDDRDVQFIAPKDMPAASDPARLVEQALDHPEGPVSLRDFQQAGSVAIAISDKTRPVPLAAIVPLLDRLEALGFSPGAITFLLATGTHAPMPPDEFDRVLPPDILARYRVISHDCDARESLVFQGTTPRGTPVWVNRVFADADVRVVVGNIEPHQFAGYSGGVKSAAIGLTARATINHNHAMMTVPKAALGRYDDNPVRQDMEDIGRLIGVHFALNTILNREKQIIQAITGEPQAVMLAGIPLVRQLVEVPVPAALDLLITSPGGHPKDINLYQAQKALGHAALITRDGGTVILVAACPEGTGSKLYEQWMKGMTTHAAVLERFAREEFRLGPHKAFQIARDASRVRVLFVSEMAPDFVRRLLLTPATGVQAAVDESVRGLPPGARIGVMPAANSTVPVLQEADSRHMRTKDA